MKFKSLFSILLLLVIISCQSQTSENIKTVDVAAFAKEIKASPKPQLIDVRTAEEFAEGHIDNATNIDWQGENFTAKTEKLNKEKAVYLYCRSGKRSLKAAEKLNELGFKKIYNLDGGYLKWDATNKTAQ